MGTVSIPLGSIIQTALAATEEAEAAAAASAAVAPGGNSLAAPQAAVAVAAAAASAAVQGPPSLLPSRPHTADASLFPRRGSGGSGGGGGGSGSGPRAPSPIVPSPSPAGPTPPPTQRHNQSPSQQQQQKQPQQPQPPSTTPSSSVPSPSTRIRGPPAVPTATAAAPTDAAASPAFRHRSQRPRPQQQQQQQQQPQQPSRRLRSTARPPIPSSPLTVGRRGRARTAPPTADAAAPYAARGSPARRPSTHSPSAPVTGPPRPGTRPNSSPSARRGRGRAAAGAAAAAAAAATVRGPSLPLFPGASRIGRRHSSGSGNTRGAVSLFPKPMGTRRPARAPAAAAAAAAHSTAGPVASTATTTVGSDAKVGAWGQDSRRVSSGTATLPVHSATTGVQCGALQLSWQFVVWGAADLSRAREASRGDEVLRRAGIAEDSALHRLPQDIKCALARAAVGDGQHSDRSCRERVISQLGLLEQLFLFVNDPLAFARQRKRQREKEGEAGEGSNSSSSTTAGGSSSSSSSSVTVTAGSGIGMTGDEFVAIVSTLTGINTHSLRTLFTKMDANADGSVCWDEYLTYLLQEASNSFESSRTQGTFVFSELPPALSMSERVSGARSTLSKPSGGSGSGGSSGGSGGGSGGGGHALHQASSGRPATIWQDSFTPSTGVNGLLPLADCHMYAVCGRDNAVTLWDYNLSHRATLDTALTVTLPPAAASAAAATASATAAAATAPSAVGAATARVSRSKGQSFLAPHAPHTDACYSALTGQLALACADRTLRLFDIRPAISRAVRAARSGNHPAHGMGLRLPGCDERQGLLHCGTGAIRLPAIPQTVTAWGGSSAASAGSRLLVVGDTEGVVTAWDGGDHSCRGRYRGHRKAVKRVRVIPDVGIVSSGLDGVLLATDFERLGSPHDQATGAARIGTRVFWNAKQGHHRGILAFSWMQEHRLLVSAGFDRQILLWDPHVGGRAIGCLAAGRGGSVGGARDAGHGGSIVELVCNGGHNQVISVSDDGRVKVWDPRNMACLQSFTDSEQTALIGAAAYDAENKRLITAGSHLRAWPLRRSESNRRVAFRPAHAPTGGQATPLRASASQAKYEVQRQLRQRHNDSVRRAVTAPLSLVATRRAAARKVKERVEQERVVLVAFSEPYLQVVLLTRAGHVSVWDIHSNGIEFEFHADHRQSALTAAALDHRGRRLVTAALDGTVHVWNFTNGDLLFSCAGRSAESSAVLFLSKPGCIRPVLGVGWQPEVSLWPGPLSPPLTPAVHLSGHTSDVLAAANCELTFATGSLDGEVIVWNTDTAQQIRRSRLVPLIHCSSKPQLQQQQHSSAKPRPTPSGVDTTAGATGAVGGGATAAALAATEEPLAPSRLQFTATQRARADAAALSIARDAPSPAVTALLHLRTQGLLLAATDDGAVHAAHARAGYFLRPSSPLLTTRHGSGSGSGGGSGCAAAVTALATSSDRTLLVTDSRGCAWLWDVRHLSLSSHAVNTQSHRIALWVPFPHSASNADADGAATMAIAAADGGSGSGSNGGAIGAPVVSACWAQSVSLFLLASAAAVVLYSEAGVRVATLAQTTPWPESLRADAEHRRVRDGLQLLSLRDSGGSSATGSSAQQQQQQPADGTASSPGGATTESGGSPQQQQQRQQRKQQQQNRRLAKTRQERRRRRRRLRRSRGAQRTDSRRQPKEEEGSSGGGSEAESDTTAAGAATEQGNGSTTFLTQQQPEAAVAGGGDSHGDDDGSGEAASDGELGAGKKAGEEWEEELEEEWEEEESEEEEPGESEDGEGGEEGENGSESDSEAPYAVRCPPYLPTSLQPLGLNYEQIMPQFERFRAEDKAAEARAAAAATVAASARPRAPRLAHRLADLQRRLARQQQPPQK